MLGCITQITIDAQLQWKLGTQFNGRRLWPLHVRCRRKTFTFAISSSDELLSLFFVSVSCARLGWPSRRIVCLGLPKHKLIISRSMRSLLLPCNSMKTVQFSC